MPTLGQVLMGSRLSRLPVVRIDSIRNKPFVPSFLCTRDGQTAASPCSLKQSH